MVVNFFEFDVDLMKKVLDCFYVLWEFMKEDLNIEKEVFISELIDWVKIIYYFY